MSAEPPYLYLTTTGRVSGLPRQIEIWFVEHQGCWYLISERRDASDWVKNLAANPDGVVRIASRDAAGVGVRGHALSDSALTEAVRAKMDAKYGWSSGLVVQLCPS